MALEQKGVVGRPLNRIDAAVVTTSPELSGDRCVLGLRLDQTKRTVMFQFDRQLAVALRDNLQRFLDGEIEHRSASRH